MKMKKILCLLLTAMLLTALFAGCGAAADTDDWTYIKNKGEMVIGYTLYEPMNYTDDSGELTGFDTEFAEAVCAKLGVTPKFVEINWETKVVELDAKSIDCIWNGMTINDELKANTSISLPYVKNMQVVIIRTADAAKYTDTASLSDATLVAESGSAGESVITDDANLSNATLVTVTKQTDALLEIKAGTADAAVLDWTLAKAMVGAGTDYADLQMVSGLELSMEEYGIGFRKGSTACDKVNAAIKELVDDGTLVALADKYNLSLSPEITK